MRAVIIGAAGRVGRALSARLPDAAALRRTDLDIADAAAVDAFDWTPFDTVVNAAAYTAVDAAESRSGAAQAWRSNAVGPANLARVARDRDMLLVHLSSDYIFSGSRPGPIPETAQPDPVNAYGRSKAQGDRAVTTVPRHYLARTSWVMGAGRDFVADMVTAAGRGEHPTIVGDQTGRLTFAGDLADGVLALIRSKAPFGTYNITNTGVPTNWADIARMVFEFVGLPRTDVSDRTTDAFLAEFPQKARRPLNSVLDLGKLAAAHIELPAWDTRLKEYLQQLLR